jgi:hypothetical protein
MAFTDNEAVVVFQRLRDFLMERKLAWVFEQVSEEIRSGKLASKPVKLTHTEPLWTQQAVHVDERRRRSSTAMFPTTLEYSKKEELNLLINAIDEAVLKLADIEVKVSQTFPGLSFVSEEGEERLTLASPNSTRQRSLKSLGDLLSRLRSEL